LHEGLIVTTHGEEIFVILAEQDSDDMLRVTSKGSWNSSKSARVSEDVDETVVITSSNEHTALGSVNSIDVSTIGSTWEDNFNVPAELAGIASPLSSSSVGSTTWILFHSGDLEEEEFVGTTV